MTEAKGASDARAQHVTLLGFVLQLAAFGALLAFSLWSKSDALAALSQFIVIGVPIWVVLYLVLNQIRRVNLEALETEELRRTREAGTSQPIFEVDDEESLLLEQNRLKWMAKWLLPLCTIVVLALLLGRRLVYWDWSLAEVFDEAVLRRTEQPTLTMWFVIGIGFICFLYARYVLALAALPGWQLLRAGAVCMAGSALASVLVAVALMVTGTIEWAEPLVVYLLRIGMIVLGVEFAANFILDMYRPRIPGEIPRPSFDSRLLGMIGEPGGIAKSIAEAVNYQFGFQVSSTWLYQLLQRWLFPIAVFAFVAILLLTSIVVINTDEQAVIERFGRLVTNRSSILGPGMHVKWPYPVDIVYRVPVKRIRERIVGEATQTSEEGEGKAVLWTEPHEYIPELMLLVAAPKVEGLSSETGEAAAEKSDTEAGESVAVSLLLVSLTMEYQINDIIKYLYNYDDPEKLLDAVAHQYLSDYAASIDIDEFLGPQRDAINREIKRLIQDRLDKFDIGIKLAYVGMTGAHPSPKKNVAEAFQGVISAQTRMGATIHAAQGEARKILTIVAGTVSRATALDEAIRAKDALLTGSAELPEARQRVEDLLVGNSAKDIAPVSGEAAAIIAAAWAGASRWVTDVATRVRVFDAQVAAYQAAPALYKQRRILEVYEIGLNDIRKYFIGDPSDVLIEYEPFKQPGLDQVLSEGLDKERKRRGQGNP